MKSFDVVINTEGEVTITAVGFKGSTCAKATEALEKAMGVVKKKDLKPEFFNKEVQQVGGGS